VFGRQLRFYSLRYKVQTSAEELLFKLNSCGFHTAGSVGPTWWPLQSISSSMHYTPPYLINNSFGVSEIHPAREWKSESHLGSPWGMRRDRRNSCSSPYSILSAKSQGRGNNCIEYIIQELACVLREVRDEAEENVHRTYDVPQYN
jgi:hypothetical protein